MTTRHETYTLTTTPVELTILKATDHIRGSTLIFNVDKLSTNTAMIGADNTITDTDYGFHLDPDDLVTISGEYVAGDTFWARAKTGTTSLHVMIVGG